jgi:hypothetical protein
LSCKRVSFCISAISLSWFLNFRNVPSLTSPAISLFYFSLWTCFSSFGVDMEEYGQPRQF